MAQNHKARIAFCVLTLFGINTSSAIEYQVKPKDTVSDIAHSAWKGPVWGRSGSFRKVIELNPHLNGKADFIFPGQLIQLPGSIGDTSDTVQTAAPQIAEVSPSTLNETQQEQSRKPWSEFSIRESFAPASLGVTVKSSGAHASLAANSNRETDLSYTHHWGEFFSAELYFATQDFNIPSNSVSGGIFQRSVPSFQQFGALLGFQVNPRLKLGLGAFANQSIYFTQLTANVLSIDLLYVPLVTVSGEYLFWEGEKLSLGTADSVGISLPTQHNGDQVRLNPSGNGSLFLRHRTFSWMHLEGGVRTDYFIQNTSIVDQNLFDWGVYLKLRFPI